MKKMTFYCGYVKSNLSLIQWSNWDFILSAFLWLTWKTVKYLANANQFLCGLQEYVWSKNLMGILRINEYYDVYSLLI